MTIDIETARAWYTTGDPVHGFDHVLRVYQVSERLALAESADLEIVCAAALLHDAEGSATSGGNEGRRSHHHESAEFARHVLEAEGWPEPRIEAVLHCIRSHRFRDRSEPPQTLEAKIIFDADKLDVLGAIGVVRTVAYNVVINAPVYVEPSEQFLKTGVEETGEAHSSYHEFLYKLSKVKDLMHTPLARQLAEERHQYLADFFTRLAAELRGDL